MKGGGNVKEKIKSISKATWMRIAIIVLSVLFLVATATTVFFVVKWRNNNNEISQLNGALSENSSMYDSKVSEYESYRAEKESEKQSYEEKLNSQSKEYQSKVDELNKKIDSLNKKLAAKTSTTRKPVAPQLPAQPLNPNNGVKTVYLTFDDGPSQYTSQILNILDSYGVKATFFVKNGGKYNYLMKEMVNRGHAIGLHTYSHDYKKIYSSDEAYLADLQKISDLVLQQTGVETKIMRFPGGSSNSVSKKHSKGIMTRMTRKVTEMGYAYFDWNCSNGDADGANTIAKQLSFCSNYPKSANTIIVLMHDTKPATMESLPKIIEYYHSQGMKFGVLTTSGPTIHHRVTN